MNKKLLKKALTAVMAVALILTSSGMQTITFAKDISIVSVYTNVDKATLAIGETKQLTTYTVPRNATNQDMEFSSSNDKIATVSDKGLVTAVAPGTAKIKVKATDGSGEYETVKITVASNLKITKKNVDSDNEVVLLDKTYGSVTISKSVGNATIYLSNVKIKNTLTLEDGKYKVYMYGSTAKKVNVDKAKSGVKIASLAVDTDELDSPSLELKDKSKIEEMLAYLGIRCGQDNTSEVDNLSFVQKYAEQLDAVIYGFKGKLNIDALSKGYVNAQLVDSKVAVATISGDASSKVNLTSEGTSSVGTLTLAKQAELGLSVPTDSLLIDKGAKASLTANSKIGTLTNEGTASQLMIGSTVDKLLSTGDGAKISVKSEGVITAATLSGNGSSVTGKGTVKAVSVEGNNCAVDTENTEVKIGDVSGTLVQGVAKSGGQSAKTVVVPIPVSGGTGDSTVTKAPTVTPSTEPSTSPTSGASYKVGDVILNNDFEDGKSNIASIQGSLTMDVADGGNNSTKCLKVSGKTATWNGVGFDLSKYVNNHLTVKISADIKCDVAGALKATICYNGSSYSAVGSIDNAEAGKWYTIEGTYALDSTVSSAKLYFEGPGADGGYYLDNVKITVAAIGDAVPLKGISLDKSTLTMDKGDSSTLTAAFDPTNADNKIVTWESSDTNVATVSESGTVKAIGPGTAKITVKSEDGGFTASCDVTVTNNIALALNYGTVILQCIGDTKTVTVNATGGVTWESADPSVATVDNGTITAMKNGTTTITAKEGTKSVSCDVIVNDQIVYYEDFEAGTNSLVTRGTWASTPVVKKDDSTAYNGSYYLEDTLLNAWNGDMVEFDNSTGNTDATFVITAYVKSPSSDLKVDYANNNEKDYHGQTTATAASWTKFVSSPITIPAHTTDKTQVRITAEHVNDVILLDCIYITKTNDTADHAITGITLNKPALTLMKGTHEQLSATILPANATTDKTVTWSTSDSSIATVDASTGMVVAVASGSAIITAKTKTSGVSTTEYSASCTVKVSETEVATAQAITFDFENGKETVSAIGATANVVDMSTMQENVKAEFGSSKALKVVASNYNGLPKFKITLPAGKKLSDYTKLTFKYYSPNTNYKTGYILAADNQITFTGSPLSSAPELVGNTSDYGGFSSTGKWSTQEITIDAAKAAAVSGSSIELAVGMSADKGTTYYIDDVTLVGADGNLVVQDFEGDGITVATAGSDTVNATVVTPADIAAAILTNNSTKVLQVTNTGWSQAAKIKVTLASGTSISDYSQLKFKVYLPGVTTDADTQKFTYKDFYISMGSSITDPSATAVLNENWATAENQGKWVDVTSTITSDIKTAIGSATTFEIALGCNTNSPTPYYIDDVTLVPNP